MHTNLLRGVVPVSLLALAVTAAHGWRAGIVPLPAPADSAWSDASPHTTGFVTVARGVRLHYLDWGGAGPPLVFLTGIGNSAHSFDEIAPLFTDRFHVLAITRRGQGESSRPSGPYDIATLTDDIRVALDSLHLSRVDLAGHSFAGQELTAFAIAHPERVRRLVYLDAVFDYVWLDSIAMTLPGEAPPMPAPPAPTAADCASLDRFGAYSDRLVGTHLPAGEIRATFVQLPNGSCARGGSRTDSAQAAMWRGVVAQDYRRVTAPALALVAVRDSLAQEAAWIQDDSLARTNWNRVHRVQDAVRVRMDDRFASEMPHARVLEVHGAQHWLYQSNEEEVVRAMRAFLLAP